MAKQAATKKTAGKSAKKPVRKTTGKPAVKPALKAKLKPTPSPAPIVVAEVKRRNWPGPKVWEIAGLAVLGLTTLLWSWLGARLQTGNADQLADSMLFENATTFHRAAFPTQHTFLLKWPLLWLHSALGLSPSSFVAMTIGVTLLTVAGLVLVIRRLESRPTVRTLLYLGLASVLLMTPAVPYAGALLPTNMAMLTTRNLEYLLYLVALLLVARRPVSQVRQVVLASLCLTLLFMSDGFFPVLSVGGALALYVLSRLGRLKQLRLLASRWLLSGLLAYVSTIGLLALLNAINLTTITGQGDPYRLVHSAHDAALGVFYGGLALATNLGANPASTARTLHAIPSTIITQLHSGAVAAYAVNVLIVLLVVWAAGWVMRHLFRTEHSTTETVSAASGVSLALLASTVVAAASFTLTKHYYVVDSRYLGIVLFAAVVVVATYLRDRSIGRRTLAVAGCLLTVAVLSGCLVAVRTYHQDDQALASTRQRNLMVVQALQARRTSTLVGDYWRVLPIRLASGNRQSVWPLGDCTTPRTTLTSHAWQPDLRTQRFGYLLTLDGSATDYPHCSLSQVVATYGRPNASTVISGTTENPQELLLTYDHGMTRSANQPTTSASDQAMKILSPVSLDRLPTPKCSGPHTVIQVVAHEDDDLLFMSPDLIHSLDEGGCVRTIYLTAGDAGGDKYYWLEREQGSEAAYAQMLGMPDNWTERTVKVNEGQFVTIIKPAVNSRVSLIFMHLPDGGLYGNGFSAYSHESLTRLLRGGIPTIHTVDQQSTYTTEQLTGVLTSLLQHYGGDELRAQSAQNLSSRFPDHSDHLAAGAIATTAFERYLAAGADATVTRYPGYPIHGWPANITESDLDRKEQAFFAYSHYDGGVCSTVAACAESGVYDAYLARQYPIEP